MLATVCYGKQKNGLRKAFQGGESALPGRRGAVETDLRDYVKEAVDATAADTIDRPVARSNLAVWSAPQASDTL